MTNSIREPVLLHRRFSRFFIRAASAIARNLTTRAAILGALVAGVMVCVPARHAWLATPAESSQECPRPGAKIDLAFIIDHSGSLDVKSQGQTYNVEIEGTRRAILDPSLIPRDASIAIAVFTFAGETSLAVPLTEIKSEADALVVAAAVESLKCAGPETCPQKGPNPATNAGIALLAASQHLSDNQRAGARRVLLMSTDGGFSDGDFAETASARIRDAAPGTPSELDVILFGLFAKADGDANTCPPLDTAELDAAKARVKRIVFPAPDSDLPGARLDISAGSCNCPFAVFGSDCERQVRDYVELTRRVLRSEPATSFLTVNTDADTDSGTPAGETLSLRQAIERANSNGGATTITFDAKLKDKSIRPRVPLPALIQPDIRICGGEENCGYLIDSGTKGEPFLTIDGSLTDTTKGEGHSDGILIRSDRDVVRGLRITNFPGAGVGIEPTCNIGFNRIERNSLENNKRAGVLVLDPTAQTNGAVRHNIGNTISMNDIVGSDPPIDLGGNGPTRNDPGDVDEGPNTLLNFPENLTVANTLDVSATASGVSLTGQVSGPTVAGATVEIFAITNFRPVPGGRDIDGVSFLKSVTANADGRFSVTGLGDSPTCGYTATVTDLAGNTSEMMFPCGGFPQVKVANIDFLPEAAPNQLPFQTGESSIENTGCGTLSVLAGSITRDGFPRKRSDDREHFPLVGIAGISVGIPGHEFTVAFSVAATFNPVIPAVFRGTNPPASAVLPDTVHSTLTLEHNGCAGSDTKISLTGHVNKNIKLIDPDHPRNDPRVTLSRSGDVFTVVFSIYDSNQDVASVVYGFFDQGGGAVDLNQPERDLSRVVEQARADGKLQVGQSFSIMQTFSNAKKHRNVAKVTVTVSDKEGSIASASGSMTSLTSTPVAQSFRRARGGVLGLPRVKFETGFKRESRGAGGATSLSVNHHQRRS